ADAARLPRAKRAMGPCKTMSKVAMSTSQGTTTSNHFSGVANKTAAPVTPPRAVAITTIQRVEPHWASSRRYAPADASEPWGSATERGPEPPPPRAAPPGPRPETKEGRPRPPRNSRLPQQPRRRTRGRRIVRSCLDEAADRGEHVAGCLGIGFGVLFGCRQLE